MPQSDLAAYMRLSETMTKPKGRIFGPGPRRDEVVGFFGKDRFKEN
jgi:hypothetical protein